METETLTDAGRKLYMEMLASITGLTGFSVADWVPWPETFAWWNRTAAAMASAKPMEPVKELAEVLSDAMNWVTWENRAEESRGQIRAGIAAVLAEHAKRQGPPVEAMIKELGDCGYLQWRANTKEWRAGAIHDDEYDPDARTALAKLKQKIGK